MKRQRQYKPDDAVVMVFPSDTVVPVPHGRWKRLKDGRIHAEYKRHELELAVALGHAFTNAQTKKRTMETIMKEADDWL